MGHIGWGGPSTGPTPRFIVVVSPCRCEPLRAGCGSGEGVLGVFVWVNLSSSSSSPVHATSLARAAATGLTLNRVDPISLPLGVNP